MANEVFQQLIEKLKTAHLRAVFLWDGPPQWWQTALADFSANLSPSLRLGGAANAEVTRYRDYLGESYQEVVLDLSAGMNYDALAALHGTVTGGGCLHVILQASSPSSQRLTASAEAFATVQHLTPTENIHSQLETMLQAVNDYPTRSYPAKPSEQQSAVIDALIKNIETPNLLIADRGRGKSTAAGLAIRQLLQQNTAASTDRKVVVTAPRRRAAATLLEHAGAQSNQLTFVAWDRLLRDNLNHANELLVIDEAGAIPQHILKQLLAKFTVWIMTTTVDGYEGSGRGFAIRLQREVTETMAGKSLTLTEPLRWAPADPAEQWLATALLMNSQPPATPPATTESLSLQHCHASELSEQQLTDCFALLMEAHYQSSPNDLRLLLDDSQQQLLLALHEQQCVGAVWLASEGPLPTTLHQPIVSGQRRPPGNLLPQTLAYHFQLAEVLAHKWLRIVRIVVPQNLRQRGVATRLLRDCERVAEQTGCVALGTSFGGTSELVAFWQKAGYQLVRQSQKLNMASGYASATMLKPLQPFAGELSPLNTAAKLAQAERQWRDQGALTSSSDSDLVLLLERQLTAFIKGSVTLPDIQFSVALWGQITGRLPAALQQCLQQPIALAEVAKQAGLQSQAELSQALRAHLQKQR
ncbi:MAG: GNAT family N-acetyltransferase [Idiomarina sp.]